MGLNEFTGFSKHHQSSANIKEEMLMNVNKHLSGVLLNICMLLIKLAAMDFRGNTLAEMKLSINKHLMGPIDIKLVDFGQ